MFPVTWYRISSALAQAVKSKSLSTCFYLLLETTAFEKCKQDLSSPLKSVLFIDCLAGLIIFLVFHWLLKTDAKERPEIQVTILVLITFIACCFLSSFACH